MKGWLSEADIEKGSIWFDELTKQLSDTGVGILSVTRNNQNGEIMLTRLMPLETGSNRIRNPRELRGRQKPAQKGQPEFT